MGKIVSIVKNGVRYDIPLEKARGEGMGVGGPRQGDGGTDTCICPACKTEIPHTRGVPCSESKCPKCGASMMGKLLKQEPIATDKPVISRGAIVTKDGHKGKVLATTGDKASVSWEDASISEVPIADLKYEGRVEKMEDKTDVR